MSCAAALATIDVLQTEKLLDNCISRGDQLKDRLQALQKRFPDLIGDVRGLGLMVAVEFKSHLNNSNGGWTLSASDDSIRGVAKRVLGECLKRGMLLLKCSTFETIRFIPPLNVSREEIDLGMGIFEEAIEAVALETTSIESQ